MQPKTAQGMQGTQARQGKRSAGRAKGSLGEHLASRACSPGRAGGAGKSASLAVFALYGRGQPKTAHGRQGMQARQGKRMAGKQGTLGKLTTKLSRNRSIPRHRSIPRRFPRTNQRKTKKLDECLGILMQKWSFHCCCLFRVWWTCQTGTRVYRDTGVYRDKHSSSADSVLLRVLAIL